MTTTIQFDQLHFQEILTARRPRLLGLCAYLTGDPHSAEDVVQEVMLEAWRSFEKLRNPDAVDAWLNGIVHNVCARWQRSRGRESARILSDEQVEGGQESALETVADEFDLEVELDRQELAVLLDRAMALLPATTRDVLVRRFIAESPHAEIAHQLGLSESAVTMRLQRGKVALRKLLTTELRDEAEAFGLVTFAETWTETRIWCPMCGDRRLTGRFEKDTPTSVFELYCPFCSDGAIGVRADLTLAFFADLFDDVKTYKPAYSRLLSTMGDYCRQALKSHGTPCLVCGGETSVQLDTRTNTKTTNDGYEVRVICQDCYWGTNYSLESFALLLPKVQKFWRTNPRLHILPICKISIDNRAAFLARVRSVNCKSGLDIIIAYDTCEVVDVHNVVM